MLKLCSHGGKGLSLLFVRRHLLLFSTSSPTETTHSFVNYLMDSLGFSKQQAVSVSRKRSRDRRGRGAGQVSDFNPIPKADSVISFLNHNGFDQSHIRHIVLYDPRILRAKIDQTLKPKIEFLREQGLSGPDLAKFVTKNPVVLSLSLNTCTRPGIQALREILGNDEDVIATVSRMHHTSFRSAVKNLVANVALLQSYGIALESIRRKIIGQPRVYVGNAELFKEILIRVEEKWGIPRDSPMFLYGVNLVCCLSEERIDARFRLFESFGWTKSDVRAIMKQHPNCLLLTEARIKRSLEFLMNELDYKPAGIASRPGLLICSLEKRIIPRHKVLLALKEKGLLSRDYPLHRVACLSEAYFVKRFVLPFKEVHVVYEECNGCFLRQLTDDKADVHSQRSYSELALKSATKMWLMSVTTHLWPMASGGPLGGEGGEAARSLGPLQWSGNWYHSSGGFLVLVRFG